jgi:membrane fusion protein, hemolysin D
MSFEQSSNPAAKPAASGGKALVPHKPSQLSETDREFLPAALEILVTPPSPVAKSLLLAICALFFGILVWSYFGWIDIYAVAPGKIQPDGGSKVVQPVDAGKVVAIRVQNGSQVNAGDVLVELDPTESTAEREAQARDLEAASAEAARRKAAIAAAQTAAMEPLPIAFPAGISEPVRRREEGVLIADLAQLRSAIDSFKSQRAEKVATKARLQSTIAERQRLITLAKERVAMREKLDTLGVGSRAQTIEALQQYETQLTTDADERGQLLEADAAMVSLDRKIEQSITQFIADQAQKLSEAEHKRDHLEQDLIKAQSKANHTALTAPISGTVQQLTVSSLGQVVASGQPLLIIVPFDQPLEIKAMIANQDIGFVEVGQNAVVKIDSFPFTRYGTIDGIVEKVSRDAVDERDATELSDAVNAARPQGAAPGSPAKPQNLVFPATIRLAKRVVDVNGKDVALMPGMAVTVEIRTGQRRAIDYLLSPLREVVSQTARER